MADKHRCYIYVLPGWEYLEKNIHRIVKFGKFQVMVSGGIFLGGRTELHIHNLQKGTFTSEVYKEIVETIYLPVVRKHGLRFEQDGSKCHTSKFMQEYFESSDLHPIHWPARSSDLAPIE